MRRNKSITKSVLTPNDLQQFVGWEIRKINMSEHKPGIIMQNPDSGEKRKILFKPSIFNGGCLKVIRGKR